MRIGWARRAVLTAGAGVLAGCALAGARSSPLLVAATMEEIATYVNFGAKNAGGAGDTACGAWIEAKLADAGFVTERHAIQAVTIAERDPVLDLGATRLAVTSHTLGPTRRFGAVEAPLRVWGASAPGDEASDAIVIAHLQTQRWSSAEQPAIRQTIERAFTQGAAAVVLVTHGPTRELIRLNRTLLDPRPGPVALMAPRDWATLRPTTRLPDRATLALNAEETDGAAFNVVARVDRGAASNIIISTPRSGWTACAGERGPGIAAFLALARRHTELFPQHNSFFICTSAHEFENAGNAAIIEDLAPAPEHTALWLHLGAGFAARDWHESGGQLLPLPSADPQRFLITSPQLVETARETFAGLSGLESPYSSERGAAGELSNIIAAGYPKVIGLLGAHRFHHVAQDDMRCIEPAHVANVTERIASLAQRVTLSA